MTTKHPCAGMSKRAIETFEQVAVGNSLPPASKKTWDALEKRGLVERITDLIRRDDLGLYVIPQWHVPIHFHAQWCQWRKHPTVFFVAGVDKSRIQWRGGVLVHRYASQIECRDQYAKFRDTFNGLKARVAECGA